MLSVLSYGIGTILGIVLIGGLARGFQEGDGGGMDTGTVIGER